MNKVQKKAKKKKEEAKRKKTRQELIEAQIMNSLLPNSDLN